MIGGENKIMSQFIKNFFTKKEVDHTLKLYLWVVVFVAGFSLMAISFIQPTYILLVDLLVIIMVVLVEYPRLGLYGMILFYPFLNWQLVRGSINVPYVDILASLTLLALIIRHAIRFFYSDKQDNKKTRYELPGLLMALVFFAVCALSVLNNQELVPAFKYLLRPIVFFYLMFVLIPSNLINSKQIFKTALHLFLISGLFVAISGFLSVILSQGPSWFVYRAVPFSFAGFNPIGGNHNAIAEILIVIIPLTLILYLLSTKIKQRGWYVLAILFMTLVLLLTFSRSGWLVLLVELLILYIMRYKYKFNRYVIVAIIFLLVLVPVLTYFTAWHQVDWIKSSNSNRLLLTSLSFSHFLDHPIIGNGLNTFQSLVGRTFIYTVEFGDPLESHGFVQKLLTETGILGFLSFVGLLIYLGSKYLKGYAKAKFLTNKRIITCLMMVFVGLVLFELFSTSYFVANMWLPIGVGLAGVKLYSE